MENLRNSGDLRARVVGLLLEGHEHGSQLVSSMSAVSGNELVQLTAGTTDPVIYGLAYQMCQVYASTGDGQVYASTGDGPNLKTECSELSAEKWTKLDPDNAAAALAAAQEALNAGDQATEAAAYERAALARHSDTYQSSVVRSLLPQLPTNLTSLERAGIETDVFSYLDQFWSVPYGGALRYCHAADSAKANCSKLASVLVDHSMTVTDQIAGLRIGQNAGWDEGRLATARHEIDQLLQEPSQAAQWLWSCAGLRTLEKLTEAYAEGGQVAMMRTQHELLGASEVSRAADLRISLEKQMEFLETHSTQVGATSSVVR